MKLACLSEDSPTLSYKMCLVNVNIVPSQVQLSCGRIKSADVATLSCKVCHVKYVFVVTSQVFLLFSKCNIVLKIIIHQSIGNIMYYFMLKKL